MQPFIFKTLKKMNKVILLSILSIYLFSCKDFFEEDLQKQEIKIIVPTNNTISTNTNITFDWEDIKGAIEYRIQVASPSFNNSSLFYMDSTVDVSTLVLTLLPNEYQWRVRAENNSSQTNYSDIMNLKIDSSYNLNSQSILLYTPEDNLYSNQSTFNFTWQNLYSADYYQFVLKNGTNWNTASIIIDTLITQANFLNDSTLSEGHYVWSIKAHNNLPSYTNFASENTIHIDLTPPNTPNLNLPNATTTNLFTDSTYLFDWSRASNIGTVQSELIDSLYIYSDTIQTPIFKYLSIQEDTLIKLPHTAGTYYWNIKTFDKAGNESNMPYFKSFIVL